MRGCVFPYSSSEQTETCNEMPRRLAPRITETGRNNAQMTFDSMLEIAEGDDLCGGNCRVPVSDGVVLKLVNEYLV